ncbi:class I SAM-dependent methyltransferase [Terriglobus tenax]|uniref:class I SAM-dependent methyltransferase n=1 Tax=Terriglobus tenax TaxID=1111115 RepID=UPI0021E00673|nr:class I SAM-dependent methyltransferase [Terriglobus tenax]
MARKQTAPVVHPFDAKFGTDTGGLIPGPKLKTGHMHDRHNTAYHGTAPSLFAQIMELWQNTWTPVPPSDYAFVDIGAGKGRSSFLAARMHFRSITGVELNPALAQIARQNITTFAPYAVTPVSILEGDIMTFPLPAGPLLLYLFNPFGATVLRRLMKKLDARQSTHPTPIDLIYVNDEHRGVLQKHGRWQSLWSGDLHLSDEDDEADRATIRRDAHGLYAVEGYERCSLWRWQMDQE